MHTPSGSGIYQILPRRSRLPQIAISTLPAPTLVLSIVVVAAATAAVDAAPSPSPASNGRPPSSLLSARAPTDPVYLPVQIGGIVGSYAFCLVLVATLLLILARVRRKRLEAADELETDDDGTLKLPSFDNYPLHSQPDPSYPYPTAPPHSPRNFSYPALTSPTRTEQSFHTIATSPTSTIVAPGVDLSVDQNVVAADRQMAQSQLEDMYRLVMEQEAAKEAGVKFAAPPMPAPRLSEYQQHQQQQQASSSTGTLTKKERSKPANLNLGSSGGGREDKPQSRTASLLSALKSPGLRKKKNQVQAMSISSPIMTPMSGTFPRAPRAEGEELRTIPPRHYAPAAPPPVPAAADLQAPPSQHRRPAVHPLTPDMSPDSTQSIDERLGGQLAATNPYRRQLPLWEQAAGGQNQHSRNASTLTNEGDPGSATSERSSTPLVGLPLSPKPGMTRFPSGSLPSLPSSPKPGATFNRGDRAPAPSAVRTGGALPLRAYEPAIASPGLIARTTKETTFERSGPLSPGGGQRTPFTGAAVPYSPYQPFSPVIPMTPSLVTRADRKRMRRLEPKTPTLEMVKSEDDVW